MAALSTTSIRIFLLGLLISLKALAVPSSLTFQLNVFKPDQKPLEASAVQFRFTTIDPTGTCILYVEDFANVNMQGSGGQVSFNLGSGTKTYPTTPFDFSTVFNNTGSSFTCQGGASYSPNVVGTDNRKIVMQFHDGSASGWQSLPAVDVNSVPYANYAGDSQKLNGFSATDFIRLSTLPTCAGSSVLTYNGTSISCVTPAGGSGTVSSVAAAATTGNPIVIGGTTSAPTIAIPAASSTVSGYLTSANWTTFNNKQNALGFTPLNPANNLSELTPATARTNLGLGGAAVLNIGTTAGTVAAGNDSRFTGALQQTDYNADRANVLDSNCAADSVPKWNVALDMWTCVAIGSLPASIISSGTISTARLGSGTPSSSNFLRGDGSWASPFWTLSGSDIYYSTGKVGIGLNNPTTPLHVSSNVNAGTVGIFEAQTNYNGAYKLLSFRSAGSEYGFVSPSQIYINDGNAAGGAANSVTSRGSTNIAPNIYGYAYNGGRIGVLGLNSGTQVNGAAGVVGQGSANPGVIAESKGTAGDAIVVVSRSVTTGRLGNYEHSVSAFSGDALQMNLAQGSGSFTGNFIHLKNNSATKFIVDSAGQVGIGGVTPASALQVAGVITPDADGTRDLGQSALKFKDIYAVNNVIQTSDVRMKKEIRPSDLGLNFINQLRPVSYYWKSGGDQKLHYGLIAQETEQIISREKTKKGRESEINNVIVSYDEETDRYGVRYTELISPLIKAVQELYHKLLQTERNVASIHAETTKITAELKIENEKLKARIDKAEKENALLKARLDRIEKLIKN